jgi:hypothetical protein
MFFSDKVSKQINFMRQNEYEFSYCRAENELVIILGSSYHKNFYEDLLKESSSIVSLSSLMISRGWHFKIGVFDKSFKRQQDIEYSIKASFNT